MLPHGTTTRKKKHGVLQRFLLAFLGSLLLFFSFSPAASAEDVPHLILYDEARPAPDCRLEYWISPDAAPSYDIYIQDSLPRITAHTGIRFSEISSRSSADITFMMGNTSDTFTGEGNHEDVVGWADYETGEIMLSPLPRIVGILGESDADVPRINLVTHEVLHVLGLGHDESGKEIMNPFLSSSSTRFGEGDLAGMEFIREYNDCSLAGIPVPEDRDNSATYSALGIVFFLFILGGTFLGAALVIVAIIVSKRRNPVLTPAPVDSFPAPVYLPPPGWYRDPWDPYRLRWWSGSTWTEYVHVFQKD